MTEPTKRERSSVVCLHEEKVLCFIGQDPESGQKYYFLPGGGLEPGETFLQCATREAQEETGYKIKIADPKALVKTYNFHWNGTDYLSTTHFFRGELDEPFHEPKTVNDADYHMGTHWIPMSEVPKAFGYTPEILQAVLELLFGKKVLTK